MSHHDLGLTDKNSGCHCGTGDTHSGAHSSAHSGHNHASTTAAGAAGTAPTSEYFVSGMTCSHCVSSVTEELSSLDGVESVAVELNVGGASRVTVASSAPLSTDTVRAAVDEAGYTLVSR